MSIYFEENKIIFYGNQICSMEVETATEEQNKDKSENG